MIRIKSKACIITQLQFMNMIFHLHSLGITTYLAYAITSLLLLFCRTNALLQIQGFLRNQQSADAVALLRAAR